MKNFMRSLLDKGDAATSQHHHPGQAQPFPHTEAAALAARTFAYFYSPSSNQFQAKSKSESTLGEQDHFGYVVWPVIITVHALADSLPSSSPQLKTAITCLKTYWNQGLHAFCAWKMFPGNEDIYYDDNAHASQSLITCFERTGENAYLRQAREILAELIYPVSQKDGGVPWHVNNLNARNACSTGPAAVAALRLCAIEYDGQMFAFAERGLRWLITTLRDPDDGLIWDSLVFDEDGKANINKMKWTYNVGFAIHGFTLLYEQNGRREDLDTAIELATAALNRKGFLFDHCIPNPSARMYSDSSFFLHHLVDGYRALSKHAEKERLRMEINRIAEWGREWMFDSADGLYFRGSAPYTIDEGRVKRFNAKFGMNKGLEKNMQERDEKGELCKTLLGCSGWVRILCADEAIGLKGR